MFRIVGDEVWLDGWLVARLNINLPATLRQLVDDYLAGEKSRDDTAALERQVDALENDVEELEKVIFSQKMKIGELEAELADCAWDYGRVDTRKRPLG